jgi:hypothetical protein
MDKDSGQLSLKTKNMLRGANDPYALVGSLRQGFNRSQYPAVAQWLATYGQRSRAFYSSRYPRTVALLRAETRVPPRIPALDEVYWATTHFALHKDRIQAFVRSARQFSKVLLTQSFAAITNSLASIETDCGVSMWSVERRLAVLQLHKGLEAQKSYLATVRDHSRSATVGFFAHFISQRNEETTNPDRFRSQLVELLPTWTTSRDFQQYALYRLADYWSPDLETIATLLRSEYTSPIVDYYEMFIRLASRAVCDRAISREPLLAALERVSGLIEDERIKKLLYIGSSSAPYLSDLACSPTLSMDLWHAGDWPGALAIAETPAERDDPDAIIASVLSGGEIQGEQDESADGTLRFRLRSLLSCIAEKRANHEDAYLEILRIAANLQDTHFAASSAHFATTLMSPDPRPGDALAHRAFVNVDGLRPWMLRFVSDEQRQELLDVLMSAGGHTPSIEAESLRANLVDHRFATSLSNVSKLEAMLDAAWDRADFSAIANDTFRGSISTRHKQYVWRLVANALLSLRQMERCVDYIVKCYTADTSSYRLMPVQRCVNSLDENAITSLASHISYPILLDLFSRHVEDRPTELRYAHEDFLAAHGIERPSQITALAWTFDELQLIYYLRYVCIPRVMQLSITFANSKEVEDERVAVCTFLKQLDTGHAGVYDAEIREVTRRQSIFLGLRQVEQSKIWIDQEPLKQWAQKTLLESFGRYQALRAAGITATMQDRSTAIKLISQPEPKAAEVPDVPTDEAGALLMRIVSQFISQCFHNRQHGLDSYLSLRIRHGALSGQMRAPLEAEQIITLQKEPGSGDYVPNQHWLDLLWSLNPDMALAVDARLRKFSKEFDSLIDTFTKEYIQIQSADRPRGLFTAGFAPAQVVLMGSDIHADTTFESFLDLCLSVFWDSVDQSLEAVRDHIDSTLLPEMNTLFISLLRDLDAATAFFPTPELDNAVRNAQTRARHALEQAKDWFRQSKPLAPTMMPFRSLVEISLQAVKNMYHEFDPDVTYDIDEDLPLFIQVQKFTDILIIVFDNIWRHCGIRGRPRVWVAAHLNENYIHIEITNDVGEGVVNATTESRIVGINKKISEGMYHGAVSSEGGTGLMKIRNIAGAESTAMVRLDFGFRSGNLFYVDLKLPSTVVQV